MDPQYVDKKLADVSEEDLVKLGFLGKDVPPEIQDLVKTARANPDALGSITCFTAYCLTRVYQGAPTAQDPVRLPTSPTSPASPTLSDAETLWQEMSTNSEALTVVAPDMVLKYEACFYYHGVGDIQLLWRSDHETDPFPIPLVGTRFHNIPVKIAHGVFDTPLNKVWGQVAPEIISVIKAHGLRYSALTTARFSTVENGVESTLGPVVVWVAVCTGTKPRDARDATPGILQVLSTFNISNVVVEWYEG